jgi:hypothetical protein
MVWINDGGRMVAEGERRTDGSWVWLSSGFFRERDKGLLFLSFFSLSLDDS